MKSLHVKLVMMGMLALGAVACGDPRADDVAALTGNADAGKPLFDSNCSTCHGADGTGGTFDESVVKAQSKDDAYIADYVINGDGQMPAFGDSFSDQQIADIIAYVRKL